MIETIMYMGIGLLVGGVIGLVVVPLVHARAVRLTMRRLQAAMPASMVELQADKDQLRAEFAVSMRRLEMSLEQLQSRNASQLAELGKKEDAVNRLKIERDLQAIEIDSLKAQIEAVRQEADRDESGFEPDEAVSIAPAPQPSAAAENVPLSASQGQAYGANRDEVISLSPQESRGGEVIWAEPPAAAAERAASAREATGRAAASRRFEPSIEVFPRPSGAANERPSFCGRMARAAARMFALALIAAGAALAWQYHGDEAQEMLKVWAASLEQSPSVSNAKAPATTDLSANEKPPEVVQQPEPVVTPDRANVQQGEGQLPATQGQAAEQTGAGQEQVGAQPASSPVQGAEQPPTGRDESEQQSRVTQERIAEQPAPRQQLTARQQQWSRAIAKLHAQPGRKSSMSARRQPPRTKLVPVPETRPTTIAGWKLRNVSNGTVVLEGPNGRWRARQGDMVPGGGRWIVATSKGLISTP